MSALRLEQLAAHLERTLAQLYVLHGDEPLLSLEAGDAIRSRARAAGFTERVVLAVERSFRWEEFLNAGASLSLFGEKRLLELRIPSGKPGADGGRAIVEYCERLGPDSVTLVWLPRLDRTSQSSAWFAALERAGTVVNIFPLERTKLPDWIAARLARQKQRANADTLRFLADSVEGNLLAAHQEIQKIGLLCPPGEISFEAVRAAVLNVARYDPGKLTEPMLAGEPARYARMLEGLRGEGEPTPRILWILAEEIRAIARIQAGLWRGRDLSQLCRENRVWGEPRQGLVARAARRFESSFIAGALEQAARADRVIKGVANGDPWDELLQLGLRFATRA